MQTKSMSNQVINETAIVISRLLPVPGTTRVHTCTRPGLYILVPVLDKPASARRRTSCIAIKNSVVPCDGNELMIEVTLLPRVRGVATFFCSSAKGLLPIQKYLAILIAVLRV